ncbi:late embryogenesis abundant protein At1g64065-like [Primulina eburnea]|uniref:late embryogenesis abundant protein At1g64065-like n=1 Tax=Primulina eburnea TaxID=1245227 RepID=UPI003C6C1DA4
MAEKPSTPSQANPYGRVDEEVAISDERRRNRKKCFVYVLAFIVLQTCVFLIFGLTIMKVRSPKFRAIFLAPPLWSATFNTFEVATLNTNSSFSIKMIAELGVKNPNFGKYKYQNSTIEFYYLDMYKVGEAVVPRASAESRSTRKFEVTVDLSSTNVPSEVISGQFRSRPIIPLTSQSTVRGKVEIMKLMKKNKSSNMNCTMDINISSKNIENLTCR